jgi:hypothetical protein
VPEAGDILGCTFFSIASKIEASYLPTARKQSTRLRMGAMEDADSDLNQDGSDDDSSPAITVGLAALAVVLLSVVLGVLTLLVRG